METEIKGRRKSSRKLKKWHKWVGLVFTLFLLMFAVSGIFLNHRRAIASWEVPRGVLAKGYRYDNWNNGAVRGTLRLSPDSILLYGNNGVWLTDSMHSAFARYSAGMKKGADNRSVSNMVETASGDIFAAVTFGLYRLDVQQGMWRDISYRLPTKERISDITAVGDTLVVMSRSHLFVSEYPFETFFESELPEPENYSARPSLFRTMWLIHSGEIFGIPGKIFVDIIGVLTIVLCVTGIILVFCPKAIKRRSRKGKDVLGRVALLKGSLRWHNKVGSWFLVFFLIIALTGMFLRPPLLIGIARAKTKPIPGSTLDSPNPWYDKLRSIRYDYAAGEWIIYSSEGFYTAATLTSCPRKLLQAPPVSVMGVNVLRQTDSTHWVVGSFSGLFKWNRESGECYDMFTGKPYVRRGGMPVFSSAVSGYSDDFAGKIVAFDYSAGARVLDGGEFAAMPDDFGRGKMSFWNLCLEVHVGRIYASIWGVLISNMFVFFAGMLFLVIIVTGYVVYRRHYSRRARCNAGRRS